MGVKRRILAAFMVVTLMLSIGTPGSIKTNAADLSVSIDSLITKGNMDLNRIDSEGNEIAAQNDTYQYSVSNDDYTAFMWVPENAEHLNGVMVAKSNLIEGALVESATIREVLAKYNIGVIYLHAVNSNTRMNNHNILGEFVYLADDALSKYNSAYGNSYKGPLNAGSIIDEMLARFAAVSGYDELRYAPLIGVGHSAGMGLGRGVGSWDPGRAIAQVATKGTTNLHIPGVCKDGVGDYYEVQPGVPTLLANGQFMEFATYDKPADKDNFIDGQNVNYTKIRNKGTDRLVSTSVEWEAGHYDWSEDSSKLVANYLDNVIPARLGEQATSGEKIQRDYVLNDLTQSDEAYVADIKMFGTRHTQYSKEEFAHGLAKDFTEEEQKNMVWFVNEDQFDFVYNFTPDRKELKSEDGTITQRKHQYVLMEDPDKKTPRPFTRITRYDYISVPTDGYTNGIAGDPMTFSMVVDKMGVVGPDHEGAGTQVETNDTPAYLFPLFAPIEWVGVRQEELTSSDIANNVASKWRNYLRWKNNRVYYHMGISGSVNLNTYDEFDENGELLYSRATNSFDIVPPNMQSGTVQTIAFDDVENQTVASLENGVIVNPVSDQSGYQVDLMVDYGPVKAVLNEDGSYTLTLDQLPAGAEYPIECKLVATQFGSVVNKVNAATPVEKVFYIEEDSTITALTTGTTIPVNTKEWVANGITGFTVKGSGTITLNINADTRFNAELCREISAERANSTDPYYQKHYQYPADYNPYDYWEHTPDKKWTAVVETSGEGETFVPFSQFTDGDRTNIDLRYINELTTSETITEIVPVVAQTEISALKANPWGKGINLVWQTPHGEAYDHVNVYLNGEKKATTTATNALITGLENGTYTFVCKTVKGDVESEGVSVEAVVNGTEYLIDDFECSDLTSGINVLPEKITNPTYASYEKFGANVQLLTEEDQNHYYNIHTSYTFNKQYVTYPIPGGLKPDMKSVLMDIAVSLEGPVFGNDQIYVELYNPSTNAAYTVNIGNDFTYGQEDWNKDYIIDLSLFGNLPTNEATLSQITELRVGRKVVGGGNGNRRVSISMDDVRLSTETDYTIENFNITNLKNGSALLSWTKSIGDVDGYQIIVKEKESETPWDAISVGAAEAGYLLTGLDTEKDYEIRLESLVNGQVKCITTGSIVCVPTPFAYFNFEKDADEDGYIYGGMAKAKVNGTVNFTTETIQSQETRVMSIDRNGQGYLELFQQDGSSLIGGKKELTISYWMKDKDTNTNWAFFAQKDDLKPNANGRKEYYLGIREKGQQAYIERYMNGRGANASAANSISRNEWRHMTIVLGQNSSKLYVNGILQPNSVIENAALTDILGNAPLAYIGKSTWTIGDVQEYSNFNMDEVRIFDITLTEEQIVANYQQEISTKAVGEPILYLDFEKDPDVNGYLDGGLGKAKVNGTVNFVTETIQSEETRVMSLTRNGQGYLELFNQDGSSLLAGKKALTISYWMKDKDTNTNWAFFAQKDDLQPNANARKEYYLGIREKGQQAYIERYMNGRGANASASNAISRNEWRHMTIVLGEDTSRMYINGILQPNAVPENAALTDILGSDPLAYIGKSTWVTGGVQEYSNANMDEIKIYDQALTSEQVVTNYLNETMPEEMVLKGDMNKDNKITAVDALLVMANITNSTSDLLKNADVNEDNTIDIKDVLAVLKVASHEQQNF